MPRLLLQSFTGALTSGIVAGLFSSMAAAESHDTAVPAFPCLNPPALSSDIPSDSPITDQNALNCFAWQQFIALNWTAAPGATTAAANDPGTFFGPPGDNAPTVWETYSDIHTIFRPNGETPLPFGQRPPLPSACQSYGTSGTRAITRTSKVTVDFDVPDDAAEAFPFNGSPNWLADRDGNQVFFEILVNRDEYDFIVENRLYNALTGYLATASGQKVDLPRGVLGGQTGSIEFKAAWLTVTDPNDPKWARYKMSEAVLYDPANDTCSQSPIALIGLHILHKTTSQPQWVWSTFEHVDNAPDQADVDAGSVADTFTFFNPSCTPQKIPAQCVGNATPSCDSTVKANPPLTMTSCAPNDSPAFCVTPECPAMPVQITREHAIPDGQDNLVTDLNAAAQAMIRKAAPDSVFANYMLVGVLWSDSPVDENTATVPPPHAPLSISGMRPAPTERPVANTTMETYVQNTTCIQCHMNAELALPSNDSSLTPFASDYSFVFGNAKSPSTAD